MRIPTKTRAAGRRLRWYGQRAKRRLAPGLGQRWDISADESSPLYEAWVDEPSVAGDRAAATPCRLSILMAVHDPPLHFLEQALSSVLGQTSSAWELILSDDGSSDPGVIRALRRAECSPGVTLVRRERATGIVGALSRAMSVATCDFVGVLDHDDRLHPRAVELMLRHLGSNPDADLVYSDEDKIDATGRHFDPYFKPDYSPELLLGSMYLNHFTAMRSSLVSEVGGFREGTDGAQDHDLALRMIRAGARVDHLPAVLYHWRAWSGSTATGIQAKPWAQTAAGRVQVEHLAAIGFPGTADPSQIPGLNEVHPAVRGAPKVSIVIPTASRPDPRASDRPGSPLVNACIDSLQRHGGYDETEIVVVHTNEPSARQRDELDRRGVTLVVDRTTRFNFSEAVNLAVSHTSGDYILIVNDDTTVRRPGSVRYLVEYAQLPGVGFVGARLTYPDGRNQHSGLVLTQGLPTHPHHGAAPTDGGYFGSVVAVHNCLAVTAAALMTPRQAFTDLGGLDESWPHDYQDVDYCLRLVERGLRGVYVPYAHFTHVENASLAREGPDSVSTSLFRTRWAQRHAVDPYYSVMLNPDIRHLYSAL